MPVTGPGPACPRTGPPPHATEAGYAEVLAAVLHVDRVPVDATSSTTWAPTRCSWPGSAPGCASAPTCRRSSMKDVYQHPTIGALGRIARARAGARRARGGARRGAGRGPARRAGAGRRHFFDDLGADSMVMAQFCARVRKRADLPSVSMKDVYQHPTISGLAASTRARAGRRRARGRRSPQVLAEVLHVERVPVDAHFFDDLGADSMVMAQFCARVRKRADLPSVSMKDVYQHPTLQSLAAARADASRRPGGVSRPPPRRPRRRPRRRPGEHAPVRPLRGAAGPGLPRRTPTCRPSSPSGDSTGSPRASPGRRLPAGGRRSAPSPSSA